MLIDTEPIPHSRDAEKNTIFLERSYVNLYYLKANAKQIFICAPVLFMSARARKADSLNQIFFGGAGAGAVWYRITTTVKYF